MCQFNCCTILRNNDLQILLVRSNIFMHSTDMELLTSLHSSLELKKFARSFQSHRNGLWSEWLYCQSCYRWIHRQNHTVRFWLIAELWTTFWVNIVTLMYRKINKLTELCSFDLSQSSTIIRYRFYYNLYRKLFLLFSLSPPLLSRPIKNVQISVGNDRF